jgi:hypothetical protein
MEAKEVVSVHVVCVFPSDGVSVEGRISEQTVIKSQEESQTCAAERGGGGGGEHSLKKVPVERSA